MTDGRTDGRTDGPTDRPTKRGVESRSTRLKMLRIILLFILYALLSFFCNDSDSVLEDIISLWHDRWDKKSNEKTFNLSLKWSNHLEQLSLCINFGIIQFRYLFCFACHF